MKSLEDKNKYPKVLVACPTYEGKDYIFKQFYQAISTLDYPNYDFMIVDNSRNTSYYTKLRRLGYRNIVHYKRGRHSRDALTFAQNLIRKRVLEQGYDYFLSLESDVIPPKDIIQRLLKHDKKVVGSVYYLQEAKTGLRIPCIFVLDKKNMSQLGTRLIRLNEVPQILGTGLRQCHGVGLGCTLIRRDVLEKHFFWCDERFDNKHSDVYFFMELHNDGIPVFVDTNLIVQHFPSDWNKVVDR